MPLFSDAAWNMAKAMVAASNPPLLLLDLELRVIAASPSFCRALAVGPPPAVGVPLAQLGAGEWSLPGLASLLRAVGNEAKIDNRPGGISVDYRKVGTGWVMVVSDNGVGMNATTGLASPTPGLGTSIVTALATQLKACVTITDNRPGTCVRASHVEMPAKAANVQEVVAV